MDPIESEDDRKKAIFNINSLLDKADVAYQKLVKNKPDLEKWLERISESSGMIDGGDAAPPPGGQGSNQSQVNGFIQQLAQKYCGDCKISFEELSKIIQKVLATRLGRAIFIIVFFQVLNSYI